MPNHDLVVIGASAGGIQALETLLAPLPANLNASILIVLHSSRHTPNVLPEILGRAANLPTLHAVDGMPIEKGHVYVAPPNFHMMVEGKLLRVIQGPRENLHRPAIDPLFRSAAASYGPRVIAVVLTGSLDDGTAGSMVVRALGGEVVVQDPATALFSSMPSSALARVPDAQVLPLAEIPALLLRLISQELPGADSEGPSPAGPEKEIKIAKLEMSEIEKEDRLGRPSAFACPDCGGVLWELEDKGFLRFRCRVGHAFTSRHLGAEQRQAVETALWAALRALEENASLYQRMAERAAHTHYEQTSQNFRDRSANIQANARVLRDFLLRLNQDDHPQFFEEEL